MSQSSYAHGQGSEITKIFATRSVQKDCAFVLPYVTQGKILDCGSGPGSITCDLATVVSESGQVVGVDSSPEAVERGENLAKTRGLKNITFQTGDVMNLAFPDGEFDIVFAHQLLNHLSDPVGALKEMKRLAKPGGIVAVRDVIEVKWFPSTKKLDELNHWHFAAISQPGIQGRCVADNLPLYAQQAGFSPESTEFNISGQMFTTTRQKEFAVKALHAMFGQEGSLRANAIKAGVTAEHLDETLSDLNPWLNSSESWMSGLSVELIYNN